MILLIDNYDSFTFNLFQYMAEEGFKVKVYRNDKVTLKKIESIGPKAIVLSPGPGNPNDAGISLELVKNFHQHFPMLGICLGHQTIAQSFGAKIIRAQKIMHGKISPIYHKGKGLFKGTPNPFEVVRYHSLIVQKEGLPSCLEVTSETKEGVIMGIRHIRYPLEGLQFHPESIKTDFGKKLLINFLKKAYK